MFDFNIEIVSGSNKVIVHNDITSKISITETAIHIELAVAPSIDSVVNTNNSGISVTSSNYSPVDSDALAVTLYKKEINTTKYEKYLQFLQGNTDYAEYVDYWEDKAIPSNLNTPSLYGYQSNILTDIDGEGNDTNIFKYIDISLVDTFNETREIAISRQFDVDSTYKVIVDFDKLGTGSGTVEFQFITKSRSEQLLKDTEVQNNLNALYKLHNILDLRNIDTIRDATNIKFDYVFNSTSSGTVVPYKVSKIMEDLLIQEMLPDFVTFFRSLELDIEQNTNTISEQDVRYEKLRRVKYALLKNAQVINSGVRGSIEGIRLVFNLYIENLSQYYYVSIESSPIGRNFVYRITTSLPKHIWTTIIRPIVHPVSWFDDYIEIDIQDSTSNSNLPTNNDIHNTKIYQQASQLEQLPFTFLDFGSKSKGYTTRYNSYNLSSFGNLQSQYTYSFTDCEHYVEMFTGELYKFNGTNDTGANVTYNLQIDDDMLYLVTVTFDGIALSYLNLFSDIDSIANFQITVTNGVLSVITDITRGVDDSENNYFIANDGYKTYVLDTDGYYLYLKSLPLDAVIEPIVYPENTLNEIAINSNEGITYNITVVDGIVGLTEIANISAPTSIDIFTIMGASFRLSIVDRFLRMELISRTNEDENNIIQDTNGKYYILAVDPHRLELYLLDI